MATVSSNFIYIGNLADVDTDESNFSNENDIVYNRFFSNAEISNIQVTQNDVGNDGFIDSNDAGQTADTFTYDLGAGPVTSGLDSEGRYTVDYLDENDIVQTTTISIYQTINGDTFAKFPDGLKVKSFDVFAKEADEFGGITFGASSTSTVVCFAEGTEIETAVGPKRVEDLRADDHVQTMDHGFQPIRWVRSSNHSLDVEGSSAQPICIRAGALGHRRPSQDLVVSPQHRILVGEDDQLMEYFSDPAFVAAKALTGLPKINPLHRCVSITWVHFACDRHEVIEANGCKSEALLLGPMVFAGLNALERSSLLAGFEAKQMPDYPLNGPIARPVIPVGQARRHIAQQRQNAAFRPIGNPEVSVSPATASQ